MIAKIDFTPIIADTYYGFLDHLLIDDELSEIYHILKFFDNFFKAHHLEILVELDILHNHGEADCSRSP